MSHYRRFKNASRCDDPQRNEAGFYEIEMLKGLFWFLQNHAFSQNNRLKGLPYCRELLKRDARKNPVFNKRPGTGTDRTGPVKHSRCIGCLLVSCSFGAIAPAEDGQEMVGHAAVRSLHG